MGRKGAAGGVRALVRAGADVNACCGVTRATALHMAARRGHVEITRALLDCGVAVNARNRKGDTPLQRAIRHESGAGRRRAPEPERDSEITIATGTLPGCRRMIVALTNRRIAFE